jgi:mRNA-degrading endonuclease RelE of RelBE toxin-antitoxin system
MGWDVRVAQRARKALERAPRKDRQRIAAALDAMRENPFGGDIARLQNQPAAWRRRVGAWRIFFDLDMEQHIVDIVDARRRRSTTY